jgi:hypothetical protein
MAFDFPNSPTVGQVYQGYVWDGQKWNVQGSTINAVRYDIAQGLTAPQQAQARQNIGVPAANLIINGDFRVNQVGYVSAAALSAGTYGHDQWKAGAGGGDYSFTQLKSSTQITIASGKSLIQPIEDANVAGGSYVLSWTGTAQARAGINTLTPAGSYAGSPLLITGQTAATAMSVEFNSGTLGNVKLESGASATPFIMRPFDQEIVLCQRHYVRLASAPAAYTAFGTGLAANANTGTTYIKYPVKMRGAPTVNYGGAIALWNGATFYSITGMGSVYAGLDSAMVQFTTGATMTAAMPVQLCANNDATAYLSFDARL